MCEEVKFFTKVSIELDNLIKTITNFNIIHH